MADMLGYWMALIQYPSSILGLRYWMADMLGYWTALRLEQPGANVLATKRKTSVRGGCRRYQILVQLGACVIVMS